MVIRAICGIGIFIRSILLRLNRKDNLFLDETIFYYHPLSYSNKTIVGNAFYS